ncbi:hypothetical protein JTB14_031994 [Gonioctena quinquepunctata]|nr:hypothetical protein JTB14_031994 [Gonioctena quinquepunctata]
MVTQMEFAKKMLKSASEINAENFNEEDTEEDFEIQSDFESDESDPEMNIPFQPHIFETPVPEDSSFERKDWKVLDYFKMYFDNSDVENMCACTNLKYRIEHDKAMNMSLEEIRLAHPSFKNL